MTPVAPVQPAAGYIGGKKNLSRTLVGLIEKIPHTGYREPFVGMGGIFLRRRSAPKSEVINDISGDIATFFRVLQEHYPYFIDMLRFRVASRSEFERLNALPPERLTDLQRAARFLYVQRLAFGGKVSSRHFGVSRTQDARFNVAKLEPMLAEIHERLAGVVIEQLHYADFIRRYDGPGALFYLDPPYHRSEDDYGPNVFSIEDFGSLAEQLGAISGDWLLSINDTQEMRAVFSRFDQLPIGTTYTVGHGNAQRAGELIIAGGERAAAVLEAARSSREQLGVSVGVSRIARAA